MPDPAPDDGIGVTRAFADLSELRARLAALSVSALWPTDHGPVVLIVDEFGPRVLTNVGPVTD